jgi:hypothetical protein
MKKLITACLLSIGFLSSMALSGCSADNPIVTEEDLTIKTHFYPIVNGSKYTYVRYNNEDGYDTVTYQVRVGQKRGDMNYLDRMGTNDHVPQVLYYFAYANDQFGQPAAVLKDTAQFFALAGNLEKNGNPWIAQESPRVYAQVVNVYDTYLISDNISFDGVIAVKYWPAGSTTDYTLRLYAKNYGLIKEKKVVGTNVGTQTEIGSLQLISKTDSYGNWIRKDDLPPIDHKFGRTSSMMLPEYEWVR